MDDWLRRVLDGDGSSRAIIICGGLGAAALLYGSRCGAKPDSYPGDARPPGQCLSRRPRLKTRSCKVEHCWRPVAEQQPPGDVLPHPVSGQQVWTYDAATELPKEDVPIFDGAANPNSSDGVFRAWRLRQWRGSPVPPKRASSTTPLVEAATEAASRGFAFYQMLQCDDGQWAGDYAGPHFLLPGFVIAAYITGDRDTTLSPPCCRGMEVYLRNHQQEDGGWGTHIESPSTVFGSVLNYVALRLVGVPADDPACVLGREFLHAHGGALAAPSWAKFWLSVLGVYEWEGLAEIPPELWLLPSWFPVHPGKFWCHCRMVYLPMSWLFGMRFTYRAESDPVTAGLRKELYAPGGPAYEEIPWRRYRHSISELDNYTPIPWYVKRLWDILQVYERLGPCKWLRNASLRYALEYMQADDLQTNYMTLGPVSKALHVLCSWVAAGGESDPKAASSSRHYRAHIAKVPTYLWVAEDGLKAQGYVGSMIWDTSFALQAAVEAGLDRDYPEACCKAWAFLVREQVQILPNGDWYFWRQPIKGSWGFAVAEQAWPVSDTTGEAFKAVLALVGLPCTDKQPKVPQERFEEAVAFLLSYQNPDGGWATYESRRGFAWYELFNPSETFGHIMIDYSYVECSASAMGGLRRFLDLFPKHSQAPTIRRALARGERFIQAMQREDGSWYGCWGSSFTYACWFGIEGLIVAAGGLGKLPTRSRCAITRCTRFLLDHQNADGGWGEDFGSCYNRSYTPMAPEFGCDGGSSVVQTSWALLALMAGNCDEPKAIEKGISLLMRRQLPSGDWAQENIAGVFNRSVGITYTAFRNVFPIWALGRYARTYQPEHQS